MAKEINIHNGSDKKKNGTITIFSFIMFKYGRLKNVSAVISMVIAVKKTSKKFSAFFIIDNVVFLF